VAFHRKVGTGALLPQAIEDNEDDLIARERAS